MNKQKRLRCALAALALVVVPVAAQADVVTYDYDSILTGPGVPGGTSPWLTATFTDLSGGGVTLDLAATGLVGGEFVSNFWFAFTDDAAVDTASLSWSFDSGTAGTISFGIDTFSSGGGGAQRFDMKVAFPTAGNQGGALRFATGDMASFTILGLSTADLLGFGESNNANAPQVNTVAHVQATASGSVKVFDDEPDDGGGGTIGQIPEPGTLSLLGIGLLGLVGAGRLRGRTQKT